jgi:hypothetical protein
VPVAIRPVPIARQTVLNPSVAVAPRLLESASVESWGPPGARAMATDISVTRTPELCPAWSTVALTSPIVSGAPTVRAIGPE